MTFGTGKFSDTEDAALGTTQTFYGIWDSVDFGDPQPATPAGVVQTGTTNLVQQTITGPITGTYVATAANLTTSTVTLSSYKQSANTIDWTSKRGWYMNMAVNGSNDGERLVFPMARLFSESSRLVAANTLVPSTVGLECTQPTGSGYSYIFDLLTGSRPESPVYPGCFDCSITPTPPVPPVPICNTGYCFVLPPVEPTCTVNCTSPPPIQKFCGAQTGLPCPTSSSTVKRTWRRLFMR